MHIVDGASLISSKWQMKGIHLLIMNVSDMLPINYTYQRCQNRETHPNCEHNLMGKVTQNVQRLEANRSDGS
jgi:hypothetical protein